MIQDKYTLSFNTRAALILDTITIARLYTEIGNWNDVRDTVLEHNTLQARTISTLKRIYSEISNRLKTLSDDEIDLLVKGTGHEREKEQKQIVWLGICKRYLLIRDFTIEVLSHYYDKAQYSLSPDDYDAFYNSKAEWDEYLDKASASSRHKARLVVFKMLRECGLLNEADEIIPQRINDEFCYLIETNSPDYIRIFPGALDHG
jgi:hypothetical protein